MSVCDYLTSYCSNRAVFICRNVIGLHSLRYTTGLKKTHLTFFIQSEVKQKPMVTRSHAFSRTLRELLVITSSFDWFDQPTNQPINQSINQSFIYFNTFRRGAKNSFTVMSVAVTVLSVSLVIGKSDYFGFGFTSLNNSLNNSLS